MALTTKTQIPNVNSYYSKNLLLRAQPRLLHALFGQIRDVPKGNSDVIKFRRYTDLSNATTPLTEGITPVGNQLSVTTITATIQEYGDFIVSTDWVDFTTEDPIMLETAELLGDQAGRTIDAIIASVLSTGTNVFFAAGRVSRATIQAGDILTDSLIIIAEEVLKVSYTRTITSFADPDIAYATVPLPDCFVGIVHTNTTRTLRAMAGFTRVEFYAQNPATRMPGEIGKIQTTRFLETTAAVVFTGAGVAGIDVYSTIIFGQEAFGISRISGEAMEVITTEPGTNSDPLKQRWTMGWKATLAVKILNDNFLVRIEHAKV